MDLDLDESTDSSIGFPSTSTGIGCSIASLRRFYSLQNVQTYNVKFVLQLKFVENSFFLSYLWRNPL
jgi:hypothetical protein